MNTTTIIGNLTRDPEFKTVVKDGVELNVLNFTVASDYKDSAGQKQTTYTRAALWQEKAQLAKASLKKGSFVKIVGATRPDQFTDKDGNARVAMSMHGTKLAVWHEDNPDAKVTRGWTFI